MDSILQKLEKYADNLENIVQHRTAELIDEKQKTDMLLHRMLPPYAAIIIRYSLAQIYYITDKNIFSSVDLNK